MISKKYVIAREINGQILFRYSNGYPESQAAHWSNDAPEWGSLERATVFYHDPTKITEITLREVSGVQVMEL